MATQVSAGPTSLSGRGARIATGLTAGLFGVIVGASLGAGCAAPPMSASKQALGAHQPARVLGAHVVGAIDADEPIDLVLGLRLRDPDGLAQLRARQLDPHSGDFRRWLTPAQFADAHGATAEDYDALATAVQIAGLQVVRRTDGRTSMSVRGRASDIERLLGTRLLLWADDRRAPSDGPPFRAPSVEFRPSAELATLVDTIVGLDDANTYFAHHLDPTPAALPGSAVPADLRALYNVDAAQHPVTHNPLLGAGETVAILGTGGAPTDVDLTSFVAQTSLPTQPGAQYVQVALGGDNRNPPVLARNEYDENVLDIDMVLTMAPLANVVHVFTASNAQGLFADGISFIVNQVPQAHAVTVSYGACERGAVSETLQINALLMQAQTQGQAWFFAAGDNGTDGCQDGSPTGVPSVGWPASSPYAFGVGGTAISVGVEIAWRGGGGGLSELFPKPLWQVGLGPYPDDDARQVPDVSALAGDPGIAIVEGNAGLVLEGTSAAAPMWAGLWALVDEARDGVGMADYHERLYALGKLGTGAFHDITMGKNGDGATPGYPAQAGYDLATGWGTPDAVLLIGGLP